MESPDPRDQLVDRMLAELLGGERPPDLSASILRRAGQRTGWRRRWWASGIAAAIVLAATGIWMLRGRYPEPRAAGAVAVADGGVIRRGSALRTTGDATLGLGGYVQLTLAPASDVTLEGLPRDESIYLRAGEVLSDVDSGHGSFSVRTDDGLVRVTGTRFLVAVRPIYKGDPVTKQTFVKVLAGTVIVSGAWGSRALKAGSEFAMPSATLAAADLAAEAKETKSQVKTGTIGTVDAKAKTFELKREPRPLTMTVNDKTTITLDGKPSTFDAAVKADLKVSVTYAKTGDDRVASKVEVTTEKK